MERIDSIDDARVAAYRNLRDRTLRGESIFVTEGRILTQRLLESRCEVQSLLVTDDYAAEFQALSGARIPLYVGAERLLVEVVGFPFHRGVLGLGRRPPPATLDEVLAGSDRQGPLRLVLCPEITKPENMGLVFRSAGAFGLDGVILGAQCCDPFSRRCLRVSMGGALCVPFTKTSDLAADLERLKGHWGVELVASVLDPRAEPLSGFRWPRRAALLVGNEYDGLRGACLDRCEHRVTIPMARGVDSLNLGVATGIFLYEMTRDRALPTRIEA